MLLVGFVIGVVIYDLIIYGILYWYEWEYFQKIPKWRRWLPFSSIYMLVNYFNK